MAGITTTEWMNELKKYETQDNDGWYSTAEVGEACGHNANWALQNLKKSLKEGKVEFKIGRRYKLTGAPVDIPLWRLVGKSRHLRK